MIDVMNFHQPDRSGIDYLHPATVEEAVGRLAKGKAAIMAGGTDLMIDIRAGKFLAGTLVDVTRIPEMRGIREEEGRISIGATTTIETIRQNPLVREKLPALASSCDNFAGLQVRNQGTIGGNLCHAAPCGDVHPPLILYEGLAEIASPGGRRTIPVGETLSGPNRSALKPDELVVRFLVTPRKSRLNDFQKIGRRKDLAISRVSLALMFDTAADDTITLARVVLGACMPTTRRMARTEEFVTGKKVSWAMFREAAALMASEMIGITGRRPSLAYKEPAIQGLFMRMIVPMVKGA